MGFQFNKNLYDNKLRQKYLEAERNRDLIFQKYPEIKKVNEYLNRLKKEHRLLQIQSLLVKNTEPSENPDPNLTSLAEEIIALNEKYQKLLKKHQLPTNFAEPQWDCPHCLDTGRIIDHGISKPCICSLKHRRQLLLSRSGLPKRLAEAHFQKLNLELYSTEQMQDNPQYTIRENAELVFDAAKTFAYKFQDDKRMRGLLIEGHVGSGKSYLLGCIANYLINRDIEIRYLVYGDLIQQIKSSFQSDSKTSTEEILEELLRVPVLLIDDLGTEYITEFTSSTLYHIIDRRYRDEKPFIVTSNFSPNELSQRMGLMGERIFQRIVETCRYLQLTGNIRERITLAQLSKRGVDQ